MAAQIRQVPFNAVLQNREEYEEAIKELQLLKLSLHPDAPKNWDTLAGLSIISKLKPHAQSILDAGGEYYSVILPDLKDSGIGKELIALNLAFKENINSEDILYIHGDLTDTEFPDNYFDAVTCLSVIEHHVDPRKYFQEMSRILKPSGVLFTSIDYWETPIDTRNLLDDGKPIKIFTKENVEELIQIANDEQFSLVDPISYTCGDKVVHWSDFDLRFTFMYFTLIKRT